MDARELPPDETEALVNDVLAPLVRAAAARGPADLAQLWDEVVEEHGHEVASRAWQEGLSSTDIGQT